MGMKIGLSLIRIRSVTAGGGGSAPSAFSAGQWIVADAATSGQATVTITALPPNGGSSITALQYSIAGGAWMAFAAATTGSYTIGGFLNGMATNVAIRAANAVGPAATSDTKSVTTSTAATAPAAFTAGQWGIASAGSGLATVNILALPSNGGSAITALQYRIGAGAWTGFAGQSTGSYAVSGFADGTPTNVLVRAVNAIGGGADSDTKSVTTGLTVPNQAASFGAKTLQNGGCFRPLNSLGQPVNLTATPAPVLMSGSLGAYVPTITTTGPGTGLTFNSGGAGAPASAVLRVAVAGGGTVDLTIQTAANTFHVASLQQATTAYASATCVLGDTIRLRAGDHNLAMSRVILQRGSSPSGAWTGGSDLATANWVTLTRDAGQPTRIGALEVGGSGGTHARYLRVHDLEFVSTVTANTNGGTADVSAQLMMNGNFSSSATMAVTNCVFGHSSLVTGENIAFTGVNLGPLTAILMQGGPFWIEGNTVVGAFVGINANSYNSTGAPPIIRRNVVKRAQVDGMLIGQCTGLICEGNVITDKLWPHTALTVTGVTPGNPTVFAVADTTRALDGALVTLTGFTGAFAGLVGRCEILSSKTATTLTLPINSTGLTWNGVGGTLRCTAENHGDLLQFTENNGAAANQINVILRGNRLLRGYADGHWMPEGQGMFAGNSGVTSDRTGWLIEGNIVECTLVRGISISKLRDSTVRSNTVVRVLGLDGGSGGSSPSIIIEGGANNIYRDNIANGFSLAGSALENTNNATLSITNTENIPAFAANVTAFQGAFASPPATPDTTYDPTVAYATRTSGGTFAGPIYPGATPYFNYTTLAYMNPRV